MRTKIDLGPLEIFFTKDIRPEDLGEYLDEIMYEYAYYALRHPDDVHAKADSKLFYLKELRDLMKVIATE